MTDFVRWILFASDALLLLLSVLALGACVPLPKQKVLDYCDMPGPGCGALESLPPEIQAELVEQAWCCASGDPCYPVDSLTDCDISDIAIYCEYGLSHPSSGPLGSGFECFG